MLKKRIKVVWSKEEDKILKDNY